MKPLSEYRPGDMVRHRAFGRGKLIEVHKSDDDLRWRVEFDTEGTRVLAMTEAQLEESENRKDTGDMDMDVLKDAIREVLQEESVLGEAGISNKWYGGKIVLHPGSPDLKPKEIPINDFFHKIVMVRDRLRVLEQRINSHGLLDDAEKVNLQQYITRIYGSLTTFNILFTDREDWFVGSKGES